MFEAIISYFTNYGVSRGLAIAYLAVSALIVVMSIVAGVMHLMIFIRYFASNRRSCISGKSSFDVARQLLDDNGMSDVNVMKSGLIRAWIFGNSYSIKRNTIFLRGTIADKRTLTAVGLAVQKVGVAKMCHDGDKAARTRYYMQLVGLFGPFLLIPIILLGMVIDFIIFHVFGIFSVIAIVIGLVIMSAGFVVTLLNIPVEKRANAFAMEMLERYSFCTDEERQIIKKVLDTYIIAYICDFIVAVLRIIQLILEIAIRLQSAKGND